MTELSPAKPSGLAARWRGLRARIRATPSLQIVQGVLRRLPGRFVYVDHLCLLRFDGLPLPPPALQRARGETRAATPADIPAMAACEGKPEREFAQRFALGHRAVVGLVDGGVVGYEWYCDGAQYEDAKYRFTLRLPAAAVYAYDAYIRPEYRLKGVWIWFKSWLAARMQEWERNSVITCIDFNNQLSLNTHLRFGFAPYRGLWVIRLFNRYVVVGHAVAADIFGRKKQPRR